LTFFLTYFIKAGVNFHPSTPKEDILKLLGSKGVQIPNKINYKMYKSEDSNYDNLHGRIPKKFDARKKWKKCKTIGRIRDQGNWGSCWVCLILSIIRCTLITWLYYIKNHLNYFETKL